MSWCKKLFSNKDINSDKYQNAIREISSQFHQNPEKLNDFAIFKEDLEGDNHLLYFSPTCVQKFSSIINDDIGAEKCEKPNLNNAKLFLGRFV